MKKMRKLQIFALILTVLVISSSIVFAGNPLINIFVNGERVAFSIAPRLENNRVFVPVRDIYESLGGKVTWDGDNRAVHVDFQQEVPKNVIVLIGDGMGMGQMEIARLFEYGKEGRLFMQSLPHVALLQTYSADNIVTDSAAAGTALATAHKTNNGMIGVTPDGKEVDSILDLFQQAGKKVGVISTNTATDATPAAFTASVTSRSAQPETARQMLENEYDVILGGGLAQFSPARQNGVDLVQEFKNKGYAFVTDKHELASAKGDRLLGLFHDSFMNYKMDREALNSQEPTLVEMTEKALEFLAKGDQGFFVMVEGARIDHAAHAADIPGVWKETIEFDEAVRYAVEWADKHGDTLVVVLSDHETMGIAASEPMKIEALKQVKISPELMATKLVKTEDGKAYTADSVKNVLKTYANIELTDEEVAIFNKNVLKPDGSGEFKLLHEIGWEIGSIIADRNYAGVMDRKVRELGVTGGHTGNMVPVFAYGVGAEVFNGVLDNTDVPQMLAELLGYRNLK